MSQALHHHYPTQHLSNTFADVFADSKKEGFEPVPCVAWSSRVLGFRMVCSLPFIGQHLV